MGTLLGTRFATRLEERVSPPTSTPGLPRRRAWTLACLVTVSTLLLASVSIAQAQDTAKVVLLVRHAEKQATGDDPALTPAGSQRATLLASTLEDAGLTTIFTSSARRTKDTAAPTAKALKLTPAELNIDAAKARAQLLAATSRVLVVGHSNTVPELIAALGGPKDLKIADEEFDRLFVLTLPAQGAPTLVALRYGAPPAHP